MPSLPVARAADAFAIQDAIHQWGYELDRHSGVAFRATAILTPDCRYHVGGRWREGIDEIEAYYVDREARLTEAGHLPTMRHVITNFRIAFPDADRASADFTLIFFASEEPPEGPGACDPKAVADVRMECRRGADGDWKIASFDSSQAFRRA